MHILCSIFLSFEFCDASVEQVSLIKGFMLLLRAQKAASLDLLSMAWMNLLVVILDTLQLSSLPLSL